jgi:hypothetical protein
MQLKVIGLGLSVFFSSAEKLWLRTWTQSLRERPVLSINN